MASGDTLLVFTPLNNDPPSSAFATLATRNGHPVLNFDASTAEQAQFHGVMPRHYDGGGLTCTVIWLAATATSGQVLWQIRWERHDDDGTDLDSDSFAAYNNGADTAASASGEPSYKEITFTDGADMDSVAAGESFRIDIRRFASDLSDTMSGDAQLLAIEIRET